MQSRSLSRAVTVSIGVHALVVAYCLVAGRHGQPAHLPAAPQAITVDLVSPVTTAAEPPALAASASTQASTARPTGSSGTVRTAAPRGQSAGAQPVGAQPVVRPSAGSAPAAVPGREPPGVALEPVMPSPPRVDAQALLRSTAADAARLVAAGEIQLRESPQVRPDRDLVPRTSGTAQEQATAASAGYIQGLLAETHHHDPPGVRDYYWYLRRRMVEHWTPGVSREPSMADALVSSLWMSPAQIDEVHRSAYGQMLTPGPAGAAVDALNAQHAPGDAPQVPFQGIIDASRGTARITSAEIEVDQDSDGRVRAVRVVRTSRIRSFDDAALQAVQAALPLQAPVPLPGGRRSRWSFQVAASRDPFVPGAGIEFDESSGWFEVHYPGRLHLRSRIWLEHSSPLGS